MSPTSWLEKLDAFAPPFIDAAIRGAVVLLIALVVTHALRRRSAAARHLVWVGAIVVQLLLPLFAIWGPRWELAISSRIVSVLPIDLPTTGVTAPSTNGVRDGGPTTGAPDGGVTAPTIHEAPSGARQVEQAVPSVSSKRQDASTQSQPLITGRALLLTLWALGALIVLARLAIGTTMVAKLARKGARVDDGSWLSLAQKLSNTLQIDRPLTLLRGDRLGVPVTWGIVYPVVLLPDDADDWPEERRRFVLVHEMAHVKRLDALTQLAGQLALALFWFDPLVWIANRRMQLEREHACDDYVLRHGTAPSMYAEELLSMVRSLGTPDHRTAQPAFAALAMARRSEFEGRMLSILDPVLDRHPLSKGRTFASAFAALLLVVPLAALHPYQRAQAVQPTTTASLPTHRVSSPKGAGLADAADSLKAKARVLDEFPESFKVHFGAGGVVVAPKASRSTATPQEPAVIETVSGKALSCDEARFGSAASASTHTHATVNDDGSMFIDYSKFAADRCVSATIIGKLGYTAKEDDIVQMPLGSHAVFRERTPQEDRIVSISRASDGTIVRSYRVNGANEPFDGRAKAWLGSYLPFVLMETGVNVAPRVERWKSEGGTDGVLAHIEAMSSSSAKRAHYDAFLSVGPLSSADLDKVVRQAGTDLRGSSSDLRAILEKAAPTQAGGIRSGSALEAAIASINSSGDKTAVLATYGRTKDRDMLLSVMRIARTINSSGDKARLLEDLAANYLGGTDKELHDAFFLTASTIPSSGDLRNLLETVIPYSQRSSDIVMHIIEASRLVPSSGDRADVLIMLIETGSVRSKEQRDAFFAAANTVPSEGDRARVLQAAARH
jgi:beta-lactamase regulating signal transducer with metallopeptidase domain